ncbi:3-hydroxyacyl-CoA dehydrogenase family protein [Paenibacillus turpanensis]|uniref:3-hydroxyacyl-CoA dehydrogenase family protein n=1 Tax=Paenibacillus turpanensis TaxID=2689078 RepID=UPI00140B4FA6|nr:3-hydroxyacyl-CoA dehydrogenase NAD-binding domain-containing protein [Paenibacillus turpanensis]
MDIRKVAVIGAGTMGQGIAQMLAVKGLDVFLVEKTEEQLDRGYKMISLHLDKEIERWAITNSEKKIILSRIHKISEFKRVSECDLVIETVTEDLDVKKKVFRKLDQVCGKDTILASNTSTLSLTELAEETTKPERVIGMHFIHPVEKIDMVEIIRGLKTSTSTFETVKKFVEEFIQKEPIAVYESPGFVTTRLICTLINEAVHTLVEGVTTAEDIDKAMRIGYDFRYGPLEMADRFGLDSVLYALERLFREFGDIKYRPSTLLRKMVRAGQLGTKTGSGFFRYDEDGDRIK